MKGILVFFIVAAMSIIGSANVVASSGVEPGWLICTPIKFMGQSAYEKTHTVKWKQGADDKGKLRNSISFINTRNDKGELFIYEGGGIWTSYCKVEGEEGWQKNYCSNASAVSFFNGSVLIYYGVEFRCRNEKQLEQE